MNFLANLGRLVLSLLAETGRIALFVKDALWQGLTPTIYFRQIADQLAQLRGGPARPAGGDDPRLANIERKLDDVLRELTELRRELRK